MSSNGGTLHGGPQSSGGQHNCTQCGLAVDSIQSLQVHMHYHHENNFRWGQPPPATNIIHPSSTSSNASTSPTDSENNNQPAKNQLTTKISSPHHNTIAAADSSDNQPPTPTSQACPESTGTPQSYSATSPYQQTILPSQEMHYSPYMHSYEQYYGMEYGAPPPHHLQHHQQQLQQQQQQQLHHHQQQEYKSVPSPRFHPYMHSNSNQSQHSHSNNSSSLSPRLVSSSSPTTTTTPTPLTSSQRSQIPPPGQPTPSPSPNQCDKCGITCESAGGLSEHIATAHSVSDSVTTNLNRSGDEPEMQTFHIFNIKEEPSSDILDLDSQKMVYPPHQETNNEGPLPPMASIHHGLHSMQRPPVNWVHPDQHNFIPSLHHQQEAKLSYYNSSIKQEYIPIANIKQEYPPSIKSEYSHQDSKNFNSDVTNGNQVTTSPSDFPTTTTPQDNVGQFRNFEPPTSSLPSNSAPVKAGSWKSNEARRPKTYNCTACNKWFTSSGHLKRHYNTTLHKNAVKSSGHPDPATMPISAHHHPSRDPNSKHHRRSPAQQSQPPPQPPEPPRSPEYTPQYTPPSGFGPPQQMPPSMPQGFQQYGTTLHSNPGGPPNGQAGPSVLASQPRGLLIYMNNNMATQQQQHLDQHLEQQQQHQEQIHITTSTPHIHHHPTSTINTTEQYNITSPIAINTNTTIQLYQDIQPQEEPQQSYNTIGNQLSIGCDSSSMASYDDDDDGMLIDDPYEKMMIITPKMHLPSMLHRMTGGAAAYQGDTAPPFSPDIPEPYNSATHIYHDGQSTIIPQMAATPPSPAPSSPHVTSTGSGTLLATDPHRCIQCDKVFNKACYLTQHNKTFHSGDKPYKCQRCGKRFPCDQSHEEHFAKHAGEKPFKCELCPKQFNHKTDLRRHMCVHSGTKPYSCDLCGKGFIRKDHMIKHTETHRRKTASNLNKTNKFTQKMAKINENSSSMITASS